MNSILKTLPDGVMILEKDLSAIHFANRACADLLVDQNAYVSSLSELISPKRGSSMAEVGSDSTKDQEPLIDYKGLYEEVAQI